MEVAWPQVCVACQTKMKPRLVLHKVGRLSAEIVEHITPFLIHDERRRTRKWFLRAVLLRRDSQFRRFVYSYGGWSGNISATENILDRVLSFLSEKEFP